MIDEAADPSVATNVPPGLTGESATETISKNVGLPKIYGSFWLDKSEFALSASVIKEVVNEPATFSAIPLSPRFMLGLFNLRGMIVPVVDLRQILDFPIRSLNERKVVIIEDGDLRIGLLVDRTGEVLHASRAGHIDYRAREGEIKDIVIEGLLNLDAGERIIQILDPCELLNLKKLPRTDSLEHENTSASRGCRFNCISFQFGHTTCAIDLRHVEEVVEAPEIIQSILVHDCFIGVSNFRGDIIPVADFRNFMGDDKKLRDSEEIPPKRKMFVYQTEGGLIGLLVYSVNSIISCFQDEILKFTKLAIPRADIVNGCLVGVNEEIIMLLDHNELKRDQILVDAAQRCREIHPSKEILNKNTVVKSNSRLTFIVFSFGRQFALDTARVNEVINYPETLLQPPYMISFVEGIINLRGELITIINPRKLYDLKIIDPRYHKVLIFNHESEKFGILVDSVDEIITTTEGQVAELTAVHNRGTSLKVTEDVSGFVHSPKQGPVMILDTNAILSRCFKRADGKALHSTVVA